VFPFLKDFNGTESNFTHHMSGNRRQKLFQVGAAQAVNVKFGALNGE
jgi:hypothetical protein